MLYIWRYFINNPAIRRKQPANGKRAGVRRATYGRAVFCKKTGQEGKSLPLCPSFSKLKRSQRGQLVHLDNFSAFVVAAVSAYFVRSFQLAALWADGKCRCVQFPYVGTSFVSACFRYFSLRYCHGCTSPLNLIVNGLKSE